MSLDVYLIAPSVSGPKGSGIFVREDGATKEISRDEWNEKFPGREPVTVVQDDDTDEVFTSNITHNLGKMAAEAGVYQCLWRPDEIGIDFADALVAPLTAGLAALKSEPDRFKAFNPSNGWGDYDGLVRFVQGYLEACREYPTATIRVSR